MLKYVTSLLSVFMTTLTFAQSVVIPGHAHNDYAINKPLTDALYHHFLSVEADIHLVDGKLYVAHDTPDTAHTATLQQLYLKPLAKVIKSNHGQVYPDYNGPFFLMIDIKTDSIATWKVLREQLQAYQHILHTSGHDGPVTVVISGNRPVGLLQKDSKQLATIDGRPENLGKEYRSSLMPIISQSFGAVVSWNGKGEIPAKTYHTIQDLAKRTHAEGKMLRLWAIPDRPEVWQQLMDAGVDLINTDKLSAFADFIRQEQITR